MSAGNELRVMVAQEERIRELEERIRELDERRERVIAAAVRIVQGETCESHLLKTKEDTFEEFVAGEKARGCELCMADRIKELEAEVGDLKSQAPYVEASGHYCEGMTAAWQDTQEAIDTCAVREERIKELEAKNATMRNALKFALACAEGEERDYVGRLVPMMKAALEE